MKTKNITRTLAATLLLGAASISASAQSKQTPTADEYYGHTLNLGIGSAYFGYLGQSVLFFSANYEFDVAPSFTLAPSVGIASYQSDLYYDGYYYRRTIIPIGVKGTYYFDDLLGLNPRWDIYLGASLGFTYDKVTWEDGYTGDRNAYHSSTPLYLLGHIGAEYHASRKVGIFLDLSTGVSTVGIGIHGMHSHHRR